MIIALSGMTEDPGGGKGSANSGKDTVADRLAEKHGFVKVALADPMKRFCMEVYDFSEEQLWGPSEKRNAPDERYPIGYRLACGCLADAWNRIDDVSTKWWVPTMLELCDEHEDCPEWNRGKLFLDPPPPLEYLTPRHALQTLGTEWGRNCYTNTWVDYALRVAKRLLEPIKVKSLGSPAWTVYDRTLGWTNNFTTKEPKGVVISDVRYPNENNATTRASAGVRVRVRRKVAALMPGDLGNHSSETSLIHMHDDGWDWVIENDGDKHLLRMKVDQMMAHLSGRIVPYDEKQKDIPPFKRKK
jgi:hypothetical protein